MNDIHFLLNRTDVLQIQLFGCIVKRMKLYQWTNIVLDLIIKTHRK